MGSSTLILRLAKICTILFSTSIPAACSGEKYDDFAETISAPKKLGPEKLTHLHFYIHENQATVARVAEAAGITNKSMTSFGAVNVADDPIRVGPDRSSKEIGRAQGIGASVSQDELVFFLTFNFVFTQGKLNGSSLTMVGRNPAMNKERELPILGGTGKFRFSRGYVKTSTYFADWKTGFAILKYHLYVLHF